jgi:hypothetical protein
VSWGRFQNTRTAFRLPNHASPLVLGLDILPPVYTHHLSVPLLAWTSATSIIASKQHGSWFSARPRHSSPIIRSSIQQVALHLPTAALKVFFEGVRPRPTICNTRLFCPYFRARSFDVVRLSGRPRSILDDSPRPVRFKQDRLAVLEARSRPSSRKLLSFKFPFSKSEREGFSHCSKNRLMTPTR